MMVKVKIIFWQQSEPGDAEINSSKAFKVKVNVSTQKHLKLTQRAATYALVNTYIYETSFWKIIILFGLWQALIYVSKI